MSEKYLAGQLLIALPSHKIYDFQETVILVCKHDENGAMGFVLNQVLKGFSLSHFLHQMERDENLSYIPFDDSPVFWGGPCETHRGFVLHAPDAQSEHSVEVNEYCGITANLDMLKTLNAKTNTPEETLLLFGYVGWRAKQLEKEMAKQAWISLPCTPSLLFDTPPKEKWDLALQQLGASRLYFSPIQGEA